MGRRRDRAGRRRGVAIELPDAYGPGADQDLLLTSSTDRPLRRRLLIPAGSCLLIPAGSFAHGAFSTALPYDLGNDRVCCCWSQPPGPQDPGIRPAGWLNLLRDAAYRRANAAVADNQVPATISSRAFTSAEVVGNQVPDSPANAPSPATWLMISPCYWPARQRR